MKWKSIRKKRCRETLPSGERASAELQACFPELTERAKGTPTLPVFLGNYTVKTLSWFPFDPKESLLSPAILVYH